ncbi:uncharacterized protein LOC134790933 [Cydia splendana]|uniref:uncharacterized protein LOC134790933 n=1 Tax=Cydia splendana TaxID=1100963 RepID=UPI00300C85C0
MEEGLKTALRFTTGHLESLSVKAREILSIIPGSPTDEFLLEMEIVVSKLESSLSRIKAEMNNYFRMANQPDADEISRISTIQLTAEEELCELQVRIRRARATSKEAAMPVSGKLPKLNLPEYHGDVLTWHQFWDQFVSLVDSRRLSDVDKFMYLNSAVKGEAKKLIEGLGTTNRNYTIAVNTLKERYGRVELVKDAHYSALSKIKPADSSTISCRNVLNEIETHLRVLSSLGEDDTHSYLRFVILEKFPEEIVYELKKRVQDDSVPEIRKELEKLISAKEDASRFISQTSESTSGNYTTETLHVSERFNNPRFGRGRNNYRFKNNSYRQRNNYASNSRNQGVKRKFGSNQERNSSTEPSGKRFRISCLFCGAEHDSAKCKKYTTIRDRKNRLVARCYRCMERGHFGRTCKSKKPCAGCGNNYHHLLLCPKALTEMASTKTTEAQASTTKTPGNVTENNEASKPNIPL